MAIGGVVINFTAKTRDAVREVNKLTRELGDVDGKSKGLSGKMKTLGKVGFGALAAGAGAAAAYMFDAVDAAAEDAKSAQILTDVLKKTTDATDDVIDSTQAWIDKMQLATEVADTDLREKLAQLIPVTGDVEEAQDLLALAIDTATGSGKDLTTIVDALAKAHEGQTTSLKRQFPWLDANKDGTVEYDEALQGLKGAYDGAAESAAIANGPMDELRILFDETQETLGAALLPYLTDLAEWLKSPEGQAAVDDWIAAVGAFGDNVADLGSNARDTASALGGMFAPLVTAWNKLPAPVRWVLSRGSLTGIAQAQGAWAEQARRTSDASARTRAGRDDPALSSGRVTINNYYPKPEAASVTIARDLRIARNSGGY